MKASHYKAGALKLTETKGDVRVVKSHKQPVTVEKTGPSSATLRPQPALSPGDAFFVVVQDDSGRYLIAVGRPSAPRPSLAQRVAALEAKHG